MKKHTIGCGGQLNSGKNLVSDYIIEKLNANHYIPWKCTSFADSVKKIFENAFGVDREFIETWKRIPEPPPGFLIPIRECLIIIGDGFRKMRPRVWLEKPFIDQEYSVDAYHQIISDCRYRNEAIEINKKEGICILIYRPGCENSIPNGSEQEFTPYIRFLRDNNLQTGLIPDLEVPKHYWTDLAEELKMEIVVPEDRKIPFHLWILNDGEKEELFDEIDKIILPIIIKKFYKS